MEGEGVKIQGRAYREEGLVRYNKKSENKMKIRELNTMIPDHYPLIPILNFDLSLFISNYLFGDILSEFELYITRYYSLFTINYLYETA